MNELVGWLRAQLDEDARVAKDVDTPPPWNARMYRKGDRAHILRHDPARVLRDVAAKRAIVDECEYYVSVGEQYGRGVLRQLASVYADRPGYREEWQ